MIAETTMMIRPQDISRPLVNLNKSDSDPCNPTCPRPCQKHGAGYSSSEDSDDELAARPETKIEEANSEETPEDKIISLVIMVTGRIRG